MIHADTRVIRQLEVSDSVSFWSRVFPYFTHGRQPMITKHQFSARSVSDMGPEVRNPGFNLDHVWNVAFYVGTLQTYRGIILFTDRKTTLLLIFFPPVNLI